MHDAVCIERRRNHGIGGNVRYVILFTLFSFGHAFATVAFPEGRNIPLSVLVIMAIMMSDSKQ